MTLWRLLCVGALVAHGQSYRKIILQRQRDLDQRLQAKVGDRHELLNPPPPSATDDPESAAWHAIGPVVRRAAAGRPTRVVVYGGSMTEGKNCRDPAAGGPRGTGDDTLFARQRLCAWPARLERGLRAAWRTANLTVENRAVAASCTPCSVGAMLAALARDDAAALRATLVLVDYSINDAAVASGDKRRAGAASGDDARARGANLLAAVEALVRGLRCSPRVLSSPPPIVFVETAAVVDAHLRRAIARARARGAARACSRSRSLVSERPSALNPVTVAVGADDARAPLSNRSVAHAYKLPVVHVPYRSGRTGHGAPKLVHPPVEVHARVAETIGRALERVAAAAVPAADRAADATPAAVCPARPLTPERSRLPYTSCLRPLTEWHAEADARGGGGGGPTALRRWAMIEERPGKPGLIADETKGFGPGDAPAASFRVALGPDEGMVVATYLRSYENMGKAKLYVGDENAVVDPRGGPRWRGRG